MRPRARRHDAGNGSGRREAAPAAGAESGCARDEAAGRGHRRPLVVAGTASGVGKTTVAVGLMGAFRRRGLAVAPFKVGPDYIDPGFHRRVTGVPSRNLDTWLTPPAVVEEIYRRGAAGADVSVIEGVMGLFDGRHGGGGGTAEVALLTGGAVLLVVDCSGMGRSLAPLLAGFASFEPGLELAGVLLNRVGSAVHERMLAAAAAEAGVPVLGALPRRGDIGLPSRHLGLVPAAENESVEEKLAAITDHVEAHVDMQALLRLAGAADVQAGESRAAAAGVGGDRCRPAVPRVRLAVARDEAFSFYYADALETLEEEGAGLVYFSPLEDEALPPCDGVYLGGGFPEVFAAELEANASMRHSLADAAAAGMPVYAECGGMVYLCRELRAGSRGYRLTGVIEAAARMEQKRQALGYVEVRAARESILYPRGAGARGHEFHWSSVALPRSAAAYRCRPPQEADWRPEGLAAGNVLASYVHLHFAGCRGAARRFLAACAGRGEVSSGAAV